jgi:YVTN family beta-propeller protein
LTVANLITQKWAETIDLGPLRGPHGLAFADRQVWFTAEGAKAIGRYDLPSRKVDWILGTGQNRTHMIYISRDLKQIITTNVSSATVSVIDSVATRGPMGAGRTDWNETVVSVGRGSEGFDVSPDRTQVWVANAQDGTISVVDLHDRRVVHTLDADVKGANRLKFTPDGKLVFVSTLSGANVSVFDSATRRPVKRIPVGHGAAGIEVQPDGSRVYVSCTPDNYVAIIDPKSLAVLGHIEAGKQPDGLAWAIQR